MQRRTLPVPKEVVLPWIFGLRLYWTIAVSVGTDTAMHCNVVGLDNYGCMPHSCGACETSTKTRTCLTTASCPCSGESSLTERCAVTPCAYPKASCCAGYKVQAVGSQIVCASTPTVLARSEAVNLPSFSPAESCCPTDGIWSDWSPRENCTDTCGAGPATKSVRCAFKPCSGTRNACADEYSVSTGVNGEPLCVPLVPTPKDVVAKASCCPPKGAWSEWTTWTTCETECGSCSTVTRTQKCASARYGCPCENNVLNVMQRKYCNVQPCSDPRNYCCLPFKTRTIGDVVRCA
ncbi:Protein Y8A9A.2 [Aphelenchoides avenae]|nr:Protein Y8A9A.2 [Aphelenchus avenae]